MVERTAVREMPLNSATPDDGFYVKGQLLATAEFLKVGKDEMSGFVILNGLRLGWRAWKDLVGKWYVHAPYCPDVPSQIVEEMGPQYQEFFRGYWSNSSQRSQFGAGVVLICVEKEKELR